MSSMQDARRAEIEILRSMTPARKLEVMHRLIIQAVDLKEAWLRSTRPDLQGDALRREAWRLVTGGTD
jgi:hypothetical protein